MKHHVLVSMACILILSVSSSLMAAEEPEAVAALKLEQIISREVPKCNCARASLTIGRDGMVYLTSAGQDTGYILRVSRDGRDKLGAAAVPAIHNGTADASGLIVGSHAHLSHLVAFYNKEFEKLNAVTDFDEQVAERASSGK